MGGAAQLGPAPRLLPHPSALACPCEKWRLDLPADPRRFSKTIARIFVLLAPLSSRGGGTLVATGSHRLVTRIAERAEDHLNASKIRTRLAAEHAWFRELMTPPPEGEDRAARFMDAETEVDGVPCRVEEVAGEPGDVFLMHPAALHTLSPNVQDQPRLALAQTIYPRNWFKRAGTGALARSSRTSPRP